MCIRYVFDVSYEYSKIGWMNVYSIWIVSACIFKLSWKWNESHVDMAWLMPKQLKLNLLSRKWAKAICCPVDWFCTDLGAVEENGDQSHLFELWKRVEKPDNQLFKAEGSETFQQRDYFEEMSMNKAIMFFSSTFHNLTD